MKTNNELSPFHYILYLLFLSPIFLFDWGVEGFAFELLVTFVMGYFYYGKIAKKKKTTRWKSFKEELPSFENPKIGFLNTFLLLLFMSPIIWLILSLIFSPTTEESKEEISRSSLHTTVKC